MKHILTFALVIAGLTACSKPEEVAAPAPAAPSAADISTGPGSSPAAPATPTTFTPPPPSPTQQPMDIEAPGVEKRLDSGEIAKDDTEYLNSLVWRLNEAHATWSTDATPAFKSDAERQAYNDALKKFKEPITDLQELVKARYIKKVPAAPAGKKYVINPTTHKVELANQ